MIAYNIDSDETVIQEFEGAIWLSDNYREVERLVLTDKGLYCIYSTGTDWTGNANGESYRFSLSDIVIQDGVSMIRQTKIRQTSCLQIQFKHGMEYLGFFESSAVKALKLTKEINQLLGAKPLVAPKEGTFSCYSCGAILPNGANYCFKCGRKSVREAKAGNAIEKTYYFAINGESRGPFDMDTICQLANSGQLKRSTLVWTKNMKEWLPMEKVTELQYITDTLPPTING